MKIVVEVATFRKAVEKISGVIDAKVTIPVLQYAKLNVAETGTELRSSDMSMSVDTELALKSYDEPGSLFFPVLEVVKFLQGVHDDDLTISTNGETVELSAGKFKSKITIRDSKDFPKPES